MPPGQLMMMGGYGMSELPAGGCAEDCKALFCPCYVFGKVVNRMHGGKGTVDCVACGSWAGCLLGMWAGTATGIQLLVQNVGGASQYGAYALYALYAAEYLYPYLQALYMYKSLKGIYHQAGGGDPQPGHETIEVDVPCHQWCRFVCCPCTYLGSVDAYVSAVNGTFSSTYVHLHQRNVCPIMCYNDYALEVRSRGNNYNNSYGTNNSMSTMDPTSSMLSAQQQPTSWDPAMMQQQQMFMPQQPPMMMPGYGNPYQAPMNMMMGQPQMNMMMGMRPY